MIIMMIIITINIIFTVITIVVGVYPLPWPLLVVGESDLSVCGQPSFSVHLASSSVTPAGSGHKIPGVTVWCVCGCSWRVDVCLVCGCYRGGHSGDGCDLASTLCKYDLMKCDLICSELGKGMTSEAVKYLFRPANVWCRCGAVFCYWHVWLDA